MVTADAMTPHGEHNAATKTLEFTAFADIWHISLLAGPFHRPCEKIYYTSCLKPETKGMTIDKNQEVHNLSWPSEVTDFQHHILKPFAHCSRLKLYDLNICTYVLLLWHHHFRVCFWIWHFSNVITTILASQNPSQKRPSRACLRAWQFESKRCPLISAVCRCRLPVAASAFTNSPRRCSIAHLRLWRFAPNHTLCISRYQINNETASWIPWIPKHWLSLDGGRKRREQQST